MKHKICTKCGKELPVTKFSKGTGKDGLSYWCKKCYTQYYQDNCEQILGRQKTPQGKKVKRKAAKKYQQSEKGKEIMRRARKKYRQSEKGREVEKKHREKNKLSHSMSGMVYQSLKGNKAGQHWETLVPYTLEDLEQRLENLFRPGMTWDNYGEWHVDHKTPKSKFKFTNPKDKEFQECWALENLQPLWAEENLRKSDKLDWKE